MTGCLYCTVAFLTQLLLIHISLSDFGTIVPCLEILKHLEFDFPCAVSHFSRILPGALITLLLKSW
jgi:hypothetical protein